MINLLITYFSLINGIEPSLAFKMAHIESGMNPLAKSSTSDGGLFQLNSRSHKFHNEQWRYRIDTNTAIAMSTLSVLKDKCKHRVLNQFVLCYNSGVSGASKIRNPKKAQYYQKVTSLWRH
jgi:soluble lytic murein transglycosylase-like protein